MKKTTYLLLILPLLFAFGKNKKPQTSKYLTKSWVKVPAGKVYLNSNFGAKKTNLDTIESDSLAPFYIFDSETTNEQWREFLYYLKQENRKDEYSSNLLDTAVWRLENSSMEPFVNYYHQHQAYNDYPVVGVTLKQAQAYANWLTEIYAMKEKVKADGVKITFSIPTKKQWIRAARGESISSYPWKGSYLRNSKGAYLSNHKVVGSESIRLDRTVNKLEVMYTGTIGKEATITAPAKSYYPNQFGIYNMSGNVAELVSDDTVAMGGSWNDTGYDVRVESEQPATEPKSTIGFRVVAVIE